MQFLYSNIQRYIINGKKETKLKKVIKLTFVILFVFKLSAFSFTQLPSSLRIPIERTKIKKKSRLTEYLTIFQSSVATFAKEKHIWISLGKH